MEESAYTHLLTLASLRSMHVEHSHDPAAGLNLSPKPVAAVAALTAVEALLLLLVTLGAVVLDPPAARSAFAVHSSKTCNQFAKIFSCRSACRTMHTNLFKLECIIGRLELGGQRLSGEFAFGEIVADPSKRSVTRHHRLQLNRCSIFAS